LHQFVYNGDLYRANGANKCGISINQEKKNKSFFYPKKKSKYARNFPFKNQYSDKGKPEQFFLK